MQTKQLKASDGRDEYQCTSL